VSLITSVRWLVSITGAHRTTPYGIIGWDILLPDGILGTPVLRVLTTRWFTSTYNPRWFTSTYNR